jgi:hypothetical protein
MSEIITDYTQNMDVTDRQANTAYVRSKFQRFSFMGAKDYNIYGIFLFFDFRPFDKTSTSLG